MARHLITRPILALLLGICAAGLCAPVVSAASYQVQASIPYPPPSQAAIFNPSLDGTTVANALQTLTGTCEVRNPADIIAIWRAGISIGSVPCNAGSFSLQVMLVEGANNLVARTANPSGIYGPDSSPLTITLAFPVTPLPPVPDPGPEPASPSQQITATNAGAGANLAIRPEQAFSVLTGSNTVTITLTVDGGQHPYDIVVYWGDGSVDTRHVDTAGTYQFIHQYQTAGSYSVHGRVHDVLGAYSEFDYAVVSNRKLPEPRGAAGTIETAPGPSIDWQTVKPYAATVGALVLLGGGYWLGVHHAVAQAVRTARAKPGTQRARAKRRMQPKSPRRRR